MSPVSPDSQRPTPLRGALRRARSLLAAITLAGSLAVGVSGCGGAANKLEGSLSDVYPLDFDTVDAQLVGSYLVLQYVRASDGGKTLKLSVDLTGYTVSPGAAIDLAAAGAASAHRGTFQRIVEANIELPIATGTLTLDAVPTANMHLGGSFGATFTMPAGRSLHGDFSVDKVGKP